MKRVTPITGVFTPLGRQVFLQRGHIRKGYYRAAIKELNRMRRTYNAGRLTGARLIVQWAIRSPRQRQQ